jgi:hypothetical protein
MRGKMERANGKKLIFHLRFVICHCLVRVFRDDK